MRRLLALTLALTACGGRPPTPSALPPPQTKAVATSSTSSARHPSDALAKLCPFSSPPQFVAYADLAGFRGAPLAGALVQIVARSASALPGNAVQHDCVAALWSGASEIVVGGGNAGFLTLLRFEGAPPVLACAAALSDPPPVPVEGASQAFDLHDGAVAAVRGTFVALGNATLVAAALASNVRPGANFSEVALGADEYVAIRIENGDPRIAARASLVASNDRFGLAIEGTGPEGFAEMIEHEIGDALDSEVARSNETLSHLAKEVSVSRSESHLRVAFDVSGPPDEQARDVFSATAVTIAFARQYMTEAKKAEAREEVTAIGQALSTWIEGDDPADPAGKLRWKKKLFSLPSVPSTIPGATKYQSSPSDWKAWDKIHFAMTGPQYYQYEVVAAKDGASADIVARGDLDGDGKTSTVKRTVTIDRVARRVVFSPEVEEGDPDE
jgi:hypothetical protein